MISPQVQQLAEVLNAWLARTPPMQLARSTAVNVEEADAANFPAGVPAAIGRIYAVRIKSFSPGATIAFDSPKNTLKVLSNQTYHDPYGYRSVWLTGAIVIEYSTDPEAHLDAAPNATNQPVVGPDQVGAAPTGNPLVIGARGVTTGFVERLNSINSDLIVVPRGESGAAATADIGQAMPAAALQIAGKSVTTALMKEIMVDALGAVIVGAYDQSGTGTRTALRFSGGNVLSTTFTGNLALSTTGPGCKGVVSQPAAATQASASVAAAGIAKRNVAKSVTINLEAVAVQADIIFNLRDGATGAGAVLWSIRLNLPAGQSYAQTFQLPDVFGSQNTAMTLESAAAPAATNFASVVLNYYQADAS